MNDFERTRNAVLQLSDLQVFHIVRDIPDLLDDPKKLRSYLAKEFPEMNLERLLSSLKRFKVQAAKEAKKVEEAKKWLHFPKK